MADCGCEVTQVARIRVRVARTGVDQQVGPVQILSKPPDAKSERVRRGRCMCLLTAWNHATHLSFQDVRDPLRQTARLTVTPG